MRSRNREVNIFNMSLLDILTGMMGAFLFLMLGLVPYYSKVKTEEQNPRSEQSQGAGGQQGPQVDALLQLTATWTSKAKINIYLYDASNKQWDGAHAKNPLLPHPIKISDASSAGGDGWESTGDYAYPSDRYFLLASIPPNQTSPFVGPTGVSSTPPPAPAGAVISGMHLTTQLTVLSSKPNEGGVASFAPRFVSSDIDTSEMAPGHLYAVMSLEISRDESKKEYYQQYTYEWNRIDPATDKLPPGVIPITHPWR